MQSMFIHKKHGDMLLSAVLSALVFIMLAGSFFTLFSGQFTRIQAGRTAMQAEQYAEIDTNTLRLLSYDDLDSKGAHARQGITSVADADGWQDEIVVGAEKTIDVTTESKQRIATIKIYKTGDTLSRYSLQVPLSSQGSGDSIPVGTIIWFAAETPPSGFIECNGQSTAGHPKLVIVVGSNVPDLRGEFIRGWDHGRGIDIGRNFGTWQQDSLANHKHYQGAGEEYPNLGYLSNNAGMRNVSTNEPSRSYWTWTSGAYTMANQPINSPDTKPRNIALLACIKY